MPAPRRFSVRFQHHVDVHSSKAEGADARPQGKARFGWKPLGESVRRAERGRSEIDLRVRLPEVEQWRNLPVRHHQEDLDDAHDARRRFQVPDVGLYGAYAAIALPGGKGGKRPAKGFKLHGVSLRGPGAVRFHVRYAGRVEPAGRVRPRNGPALAFHARHGDGRGGAGVADPRAANYPVDRGALPQRVFQRLEQEHAGAFSRRVAVRVAVERPAAPLFAYHAGLGENDVAPRRKIEVYASRDGEIAVAALHRRRRAVEGDERPGVGGVDAFAFAREPEEMRNPVCQHERAASEGGMAVEDGPRPGGHLEVVAGRRADVNRGALLPQQFDRNGGVLQAVTDFLHEEPLLWVHAPRLARRNAEGPVVELLHIVQRPEPRRPGPLRQLLQLGQRRVSRPARFGHPDHGIDAFRQVLPERLVVAGAGRPARHADDGDVPLPSPAGAARCSDSRVPLGPIPLRRLSVARKMLFCQFRKGLHVRRAHHGKVSAGDGVDGCGALRIAPPSPCGIGQHLRRPCVLLPRARVVFRFFGLEEHDARPEGGRLGRVGVHGLDGRPVDVEQPFGLRQARFGRQQFHLEQEVPQQVQPCVLIERGNLRMVDFVRDLIKLGDLRRDFAKPPRIVPAGPGAAGSVASLPDRDPRVENQQRFDRLPPGFQLPRHFEGDVRAEGMPSQPVWPMGPHRTHLPDVHLGQIFHAIAGPGFGVEAGRLEPVERLVRPQLLCELIKVKGGPACPRHAKEGRFAAFGMDGREDRPCRGFRAVSQHPGEPRDGWLPEERGDGEARPEIALHQGHQPYRLDGMAAQVEKVVFHANKGQVQHGLPRLDELLLHGVARGGERSAWDGAFRSRHPGQRLPVYLPARREGKSVHGGVSRRDHVVGELLPEKSPDSPCIGPIGPSSRQESDKPRFLRASLPDGNDDGPFDSRQGGKGGLDLAQFDAEPANLDLMVDPAQKFDVAVFQPADEVPGAVHPLSRPRSEWIGQEARGGEAGAPPIAPREARAANV